MSQRAQSTKSMSEAAVDGLLSGMLAGVAMLVFLVIGGMIIGSTTLETLQSLGSEQGGVPFAGFFAHLGIASFYGLLWGPAWRWLRRYSTLPGWVLGMFYGILLFILAQSLVQTLPAPLQELNDTLMLAAHCVYGVVLGLVIP